MISILEKIKATKAAIEQWIHDGDKKRLKQEGYVPRKEVRAAALQLDTDVVLIEYNEDGQETRQTLFNNGIIIVDIKKTGPTYGQEIGNNIDPALPFIIAKKEITKRMNAAIKMKLIRPIGHPIAKRHDFVSCKLS